MVKSFWNGNFIFPINLNVKILSYERVSRTQDATNWLKNAVEPPEPNSSTAEEGESKEQSTSTPPRSMNTLLRSTWCRGSRESKGGKMSRI